MTEEQGQEGTHSVTHELRVSGRTALLVVGMHRSGTSAFTRVCALLGAALPAHLLGARRGNETGHWEPQLLIPLHDKMLAEASTRWDDWRPFNPEALTDDRRHHYETAIGDVIDEELGSAPLFVLKDPRISRFIPFYRNLLGSRGIAVKIVQVHRNPAAVIRSLAERDGVTADYTGLMWLRYVLDAEEGSREATRSFVGYENFLVDWRAAMARVGRELGVAWPIDIESAAAKVEEFLSPDRERQSPDSERLPINEELGRALTSTYDALRALEANRTDGSAFDALRAARVFLDRGDSLFATATFAEMVVRQRRGASERADLRRAAAQLRDDLRDVTQERDRLAEEAAGLRQATESSRENSVQTRDRLRDGIVRLARALPLTSPASARTSIARHLRRASVAERPRLMWRYRRIPEIRRLQPDDVRRVARMVDPAYYRERYPDVAAAGVDPLQHFMLHGWKENRDPSAAFSTEYYLENSPDVVQAGINPLIHWALFGQAEKRPALPIWQRRVFNDPGYAPLVSVVVPNYNHARYLAQRLDSIFDQTYGNIEVIILDDASTDDSRAVIEGYAAKHPDITRVLWNDVNAGSVFKQWRKGIDEARGELVWICESDDFCEPGFLADLVPFFSDRSINLAFGRIQFATEDGRLREGLDQYRESAEPGIWQRPMVRPANAWFGRGFGINNLIANVGGSIFRRQALAQSVWNEAYSYATLGDWFLYVHLAGGGQIAYHPHAVSYFRQHGGNSSVAASSEAAYYVEHERFMRFLRETWDVPAGTVEAFWTKVARQYEQRGLEPRLGPLSAYCDRAKLLATQRRRPHVLMGIQGFSYGGGEVFPIDLANALRAEGTVVSIFSLDLGEGNPDVLAMVAPGVAVYRAAFVDEYGIDDFLRDAGVSLINSHMVAVEDYFFGERNSKSEIPFLATLHGSYEAHELTTERLRGLTERVSHFVYTADKNLAPLVPLRIPPDHFTKLGNARPIDERPFPRSRAELGIAEDTVVFTLIARGVQRKGWRAAIDAFVSLRDRRPDHPMHLLLVGEGEQKDRMAAIHGADPDISFLGYQQRVQGLYRMSDVALQPTRFAGESYPLILIDALLTGTPVISTRHASIPEMLEGPEGTAGILIDNLRDTPTFTRCLEEAMESMLSATARAQYAEAALRLGRRYDMAVIARTYQDIYRDLVGAPVAKA